MIKPKRVTLVQQHLPVVIKSRSVQTRFSAATEIGLPS